jgi:hypothetical protein
VRMKKDRWHPVLFQFGSIVLPLGLSSSPTGFYSAQALQHAHDRLFALP